jgi:hypothetical protein
MIKSTDEPTSNVDSHTRRAPQRGAGGRQWRRLGELLLVPIVVLSMTLGASESVPLAQAQGAKGTMTVRAIVDEIQVLDDMEGDFLWSKGKPDFYARVTIGGQTSKQGPIDNKNVINPGWTFEGTVPTAVPLNNASPRVRMVVEVWDDDGGLRGEDDHVDITRPDGRNLELSLPMDGCTAEGNFDRLEVAQAGEFCRLTLVTEGKGDDRARVHLTIVVGPSPLFQPQQYVEPNLYGYRLDLCLWWGEACGDMAAHAWCQANGYFQAYAWQPAYAVGPTFILGSSEICDDPGCDGFWVIQCGPPR